MMQLELYQQPACLQATPGAILAAVCRKLQVCCNDLIPRNPTVVAGCSVGESARSQTQTVQTCMNKTGDSDLQ